MNIAYNNTKKLIQKVNPTMSYNGDKNIAKWKEEARNKLYELLGMDKFVKVAPELQIEYERRIDNATEIRFSFCSEENYRVPCHLLIPDGVEKPPVIICLQGHSKGMHISLGRIKYDDEEIDGDRDFCIRAVKEGYAAIAVEQRNFGECGGDETGPRCYESSMTAILMGRTTIGERVWDVSRLIDVIESDFSDKLDVNNICCMGNSGGGTATAYIAALEDRIALAMPSCAMSTYKDSIGAMFHCSCNYVPNIANYFDMNDLISMAYPKYYIQVSGIEDTIFPIKGAKYVFEKGKKAYEACGHADRCYMVEGNGGHRFYADDSWPIVHKCLGK